MASATDGLGAASAALAVTARIHDIQGTTRVSPLKGQPVTGVTGVVTGVRTAGARGFWIQDPSADNDPATSEGVFVFTSSAPTVAVGDKVQVAGMVSEFYPGGVAAGDQSVTEITAPTVVVLSSGNPLPVPVPLDQQIPDRFVPDAGGGSIEGLTLRPTVYALDLYESLEGMNVEVSDVPVVGATDAHSELWVSVEPSHNRTVRGGTYYPSYKEPNPGRLQVQSLIPFTTQTFPAANVGDTLTGITVGPLDYNQFAGTYTLVARTLGSVTSGNLQREVTAPMNKGELSIATYNVENLAPADPASKFSALASGLVSHLNSPDIVALEEIQDNNGATDDGTVAADHTLDKLVDAIVTAGGPHYSWREIDPQNDSDGGEPGGNIRTAFLFNPSRVGFADRPGGNATTAVGITGTGASTALTVSPGRISPTDESWVSSRKPLVGEFTFLGKKVFVIANHFNSKGGDQGLTGRFQPPARSSEVQRVRQAGVEHAFVEQLLAADPAARIVALGDLNDYQFSPAVQTLSGQGGTLKDLVNVLPAQERYSYVFQGNSQVLDHILVSPGVFSVNYDVVHINAEFADQASDHDPQMVRVRVATG
ncbi:endonuclease/exonuclease/phosphatase family protein [Streptomyces sp. NPDC005500]|uniref:endonuclease/exonuclease/phosphatase family protein n=1 Tax=Streptomyces sp. NPDC005500 TaxID=3155007 RepID=UPI0033AFF08D